jgi:outer membrane protein assembly factor BamB
VVQDHLYVALRRSTPQIESGMACLSALSGQTIWDHRISSALQQPPALHHLVDHELLTAAQGLLFLAAGSGVVAAIDQNDGSVQWAVTYPSRTPEAVEASDPASRRMTPPLYHGGRLFIAPPDSDRILSLDAGTGAEYWNNRASGRMTHLLGIVHGMLIAQGDRLWAIDVQTGELRHRPLGFNDPEGYSYGRGVIAGPDVFWTTRDDLFVVDIESWTIVRRIPLREQYGLTGGNLVVAGDMVLITQAERLSALGPRTGTGN